MKVNFKMTNSTIICRCFGFVLCLSLMLHLTSCANYSLLFSVEEDLDLEGYELVFCDEFEGDSLDYSQWEHRIEGGRENRSGFLHRDQVSVKDGNLVIIGEYRTSEYGEGWHAAMIRLKERYTYGYFEIRCIPNSGEELWSAFWLNGDYSYDHELSQGGRYSAELDIFETYKNHTYKTKDYISSHIFFNGSDYDSENIESISAAKVYVPNLRSEYTTFGMLWTENEYVFYVNAIETGRAHFENGTCLNPEDVIVSLEIPSEINRDKTDTAAFIVDYVKIYQITNP